MILDKDLQFSSAQTLTTGSADASTNYIDLGVGRDIGTGKDLEILVQIATALAGAGTCVVTLEQDDNTSFSSPTTVQTIGTFAATSAAGTKLAAKIQPEAITERYIRLKYTNGTLSAGAVSAHVVHGVDHMTYYADGFNIAT